MNGGARSIDPSSLNLSQVIHFLEGKAEGERQSVSNREERCFPDSTFLNFVSVIFFSIDITYDLSAATQLIQAEHRIAPPSSPFVLLPPCSFTLKLLKAFGEHELARTDES